MTFDIYLKDPQANTRPSQQKPTPLVVIISHRNHKYKKSLGISVFPRDYVKGKVGDESVNLRLRKIRSYLSLNLSDLSTPPDIEKALSTAKEIATTGKDGDTARVSVEKRESGVPTFSRYVTEWVGRGGTSTRQRRLFQSNVTKFIGDNIDWNDVDDAFYFRLVQKMNAASFGANYKHRIVSQLKTVMEEGRKLHYHTNLAYKDWKISREDVVAVYLTKEEVDAIWLLELKSSMERKARDLFILGVYTVARFSDYSRISEDIIEDGVIRFVHAKTSTPVLVPVSPRVREVLDRNGGAAPSISQQKFNDAIKEVCKKAGINGIVEVRRSHGATHTTERLPKWELVSSHTARRTGATLLRQAGASMREIMLIGGWSREKTLEHYLKMTREENVRTMMDNPFFK